MQSPGQQGGGCLGLEAPPRSHVVCLWPVWPTPPALSGAASPFPRIECTWHPPQHAGDQAGRGRNLQNLICIRHKNPGKEGNQDAFHSPRGTVSHIETRGLC